MYYLFLGSHKSRPQIINAFKRCENEILGLGGPTLMHVSIKANNCFHLEGLTLSDQWGVPRDPTFVFRAFYYFRLRFFDRCFFLIV